LALFLCSGTPPKALQAQGGEDFKTRASGLQGSFAWVNSIAVERAFQRI
jgi:hypothetical protein